MRSLTETTSEQILLVLDLEVQLPGDGVREPGGVVHGPDSGDEFLGYFLVLRQIVSKTALSPRTRAWISTSRSRIWSARDSTSTLKEAVVFDEPPNPSSSTSFHKNLDGIVGKLEHLDDLTDSPDIKDIVLLRVGLLRILLRDEKDHLIGLHGRFQRLDGAIPPDEQRYHHVRKYDDVPERKQGQRHTG